MGGREWEKVREKEKANRREKEGQKRERIEGRYGQNRAKMR